ncbi:hypothetical protein QA802_30780 [Streptomyces sp. B21-105]|uniref:hypothetical protein n=1 Tax=Streptomyces sp. B21-105 TaxID=3039417 RepID=UPI002FEFE5A8
MPKNGRRRSSAAPPRRAAWRERRALAEFVADEFGLSRPQAVKDIHEVERTGVRAPLGYTPCDDCRVMIVEEFDPEDPAQVAYARQAVRLHAQFCPGRGA